MVVRPLGRESVTGSAATHWKLRGNGGILGRSRISRQAGNTWSVTVSATWLCICVALLAGCQSLVEFVGFESKQAIDPAPTLQIALWHPDPQEQIRALDELRSNAPYYAAVEHTQITGELSKLYYRLRQPYLKQAVLQTLAVFPGPQAEQTLSDGLSDAAPVVRIAACRAWASRGGSAAAAALRTAFTQEDNLDVRLQAARALGQLGGEQAVETLALGLDDPDPAIQYRSMLALNKATGFGIRPDVIAWRERLQRSQSPVELNSPNSPPGVIATRNPPWTESGPR